MPKVVELVDGGARWLLLPALPLSDPGQVTSRPSPRFPHLQNEMTGHSDVKSPFRTPRPRDCVTGTRKVIQPQTNLVGGTASWAPRFRTLLPSCPHAHLSLSKPCKISFCKSHPLFVLFSNSELQKPFLFPVKALPPLPPLCRVPPSAWPCRQVVTSPLVFTEHQSQDVPISHSPRVALLNWDLLPA